MSQDDREAVTTYVPAYQKNEWQEHAAELEMSQAEFVRTMVQAGRKGFSDEPDSPQSSGSNPRGHVAETVLQALAADGDLSFEELYGHLEDDLEARLEDAIITLTEQGKIRHSPRDGTYTRVE
jgi:hypothetical protein